MTKKIVIRALMVLGLAVGVSATTFAQTHSASVRRVAPAQEKAQPVAAAVVAVESRSALNLTNDQVAQLNEMGTEASALMAERDRLWSEYKAIRNRPGLTDEVCAAEAAPRMKRIVEINHRLAPIAVQQEQAVSAILSGEQINRLAREMSAVRASL